MAFENQNVKDFSAKRMGISMAATWSWGGSLPLMLVLFAGFGLLPSLLWLIGNIGTLVFFTVLYSKVEAFRNLKNLKAMNALFLFVSFFAMIMNATALKQSLDGTLMEGGIALMGTNPAMIVAIIVGFGLSVFIYKYELWGSVITDKIQYYLQVVFVFILLGVILLQSDGLANYEMVAEGGWNWLPLALMNISFGAHASGMQWERMSAIDKKKVIPSGIWGSAFFALYMIPTIFIALFYTPSILVFVLVAIILMTISTSTMDSAISAAQWVTRGKLKSKVAGTGIAVLALIVFPFISMIGIDVIWGFYGTVRWMVVLGLFAVSYILLKRVKK